MENIAVTRLPYWENLSAEEQEKVTAAASVRRFARGAVIGGCDESCLGMMQVQKGSIRVLLITEEGREITLFRLHAGDSCVLSASCVLSQISFETEMLAEEDTELLLVSAGLYSRLMEENVHVRAFTYELASERFSTVIWVMQQILFVRFDQRLARVLLQYNEKTGKTELRMTQEAIAQEVNTAREVVARMLRQFASDGLIELSRGVIRLKDIDGLRHLG